MPPKYGGQKDIALFTKQLSKFYEVLFLCSRNNEIDKHTHFKIRAELPVSKSQFLNPFCWKKIVRIAKDFRPDFIILEHPYHGIAGHFACKKTGAKLIVHSHNIESERFKTLGKWWWRILAKYEKWVYRKATLNLFKTGVDCDWAIENFNLEKPKCMVVPYGIEQQGYDNAKAKELITLRHNLTEETKILLFAGTLDYEPNVRAVEIIYKEIAPRLKDDSLKILICGRNNKKQFQYFKHLFHPNVLYIGEVDDIEKYFEAADIFLAPVASGGGLQTKIVDALSYGLNVVCFEKRLDKNFLLTGKKIFATAEEDYEGFINNIYCAIMEPSSTGRAFFEYYNWQNAIEKLNKRLTVSNG